MKVLSIILLTLGLGYCDHFTDNPCPDRPVLQNFQPEKFSGIWYEIKKYSNELQKSYDCTQNRFELFENKFNLTSCEKRKTSYYCMHSEVSLQDAEKNPVEGKLKSHFYEHPYLKFQWNVLATDYENYALTYSCSNLPDGKSFQMAWLNSRSSSLSESVKDEVDKFISDHFTPESMFPNQQDDEFCAPRPF